MGTTALDIMFEATKLASLTDEQKSKALRRGLMGAAGAAGLGAAAYFGGPGVIHGVQEGLRTTGRALRGPRSAASVLRKGWRSMEGTSPNALESARKSVGTKSLFHRTPRSTADVLKDQGHLFKMDGGKIAPRANEGIAQAVRSGGLRGGAEELSRRGWTGSGKYTKYTPVGMKSMMLGFPLAFSGADLKKGDPQFTGQGRAERVGKSVGETAGYIAGMPIGAAVGGTAGVMAGGRAAKWLSRGKRGLLPMMVGSAITGTAGAMAGRALGRPIDLATGERQTAQARKGLKTYLDYRQKQLAQQGAY